ncbi:HAMP domain-containing histidine kinase [Candidatus Fermentibacterales bacterium]|nr:HAMP domain-containing histidine kinase [Candidatus Fermentibacterales bacterium]
MRGIFSRVLVLLLACIVAIAFVLYNHDLVNRLQDRNRRSNETIAWFWAGTQVPFSMLLLHDRLAVCTECGLSLLSTRSDSGAFRMYCPDCGSVTKWVNAMRWTGSERQVFESQARELFTQLISRLDYTVILTDIDGVPQVRDGVSLPDELPSQRSRSLRRLLRALDAENEPLPLTRADGDTIGWLHYGGSSLEDEFRYVPYIELGLLMSLALVLLLGVRGEIRRERGMAWVGFAKETAHQLGTPLSSLLGWLEVLRDRPDLPGDTELQEAIDSMGKDVSRLQQIARRYGELGRTPSLETESVNTVVEEIVDYFRSRPGLMGGNSRIDTKLNATRMVSLNPVLLSWVMENLIKNSLAAVSSRKRGVVTISTRNVPDGAGGVEIQITDNGSGIPFVHQKKIFNAGFSTRRGGWGLGLTLAMRIVEEYHRGAIRLVVSSPEKGSTFVISLPTIAETRPAERKHRRGKKGEK